MNDALTIVQLKFVKPFESDAQTIVYKKRTLRHHRKAAGVYIIKENDKVVYIGMSRSCVVEALYRHFYEWNDKRGQHVRVTYFDKMRRKNYEVIIMITCKEDAPKLERSLIVSFSPRDNKEKFEGMKEEVNSHSGWQAVTDVEF